MNKPHKHAEVIKAWADGAPIEYKHCDGSWHLDESPKWHITWEYRVKEDSWIKKLKDAHKEGKTLQMWAVISHTWLDMEFTGPNTTSIDDWHPFFNEACYRIKPEKIVRWQWVIQTKHGQNRTSLAFYTQEEICKELDMSNYKVICKAEWTRMEFAE